MGETVMGVVDQSTATSSISVGLGEMKVLKNTDSTLACLGLGSCVGVAAWDPVARVAGMAHVVLPSSQGRRPDSGAKYADRAIPKLIQEVGAQGALKSRLVIKIAGGAQMALSSANDPIFKIGEQNVTAVLEAIDRESLRVEVKETGGNRGRTLRLNAASGETQVSVAGEPPRKL